MYLRHIIILALIGLFAVEIVNSTCGARTITTVNCSNSTVVVKIVFNITNAEFSAMTTIDARRRRVGSYGTTSTSLQSTNISSGSSSSTIVPSGTNYATYSVNYVDSTGLFCVNTLSGTKSYCFILLSDGQCQAC